jgi:hypothetical protein
MKFCSVYPEICRGRVHGPRKERRKRRIRIIIIIKIIIRNWAKTTLFGRLNYLILRSKIKVPKRLLRYATHRLMVMHIRTICQWTALLDLFELFDLDVKGQGPTTHHLMVMYIQTICPWTVLLDLFDLEVKGQGPMKVITVRDTPPYGHAPTY